MLSTFIIFLFYPYRSLVLTAPDLCVIGVQHDLSHKNAQFIELHTGVLVLKLNVSSSKLMRHIVVQKAQFFEPIYNYSRGRGNQSLPEVIQVLMQDLCPNKPVELCPGSQPFGGVKDCLQRSFGYIYHIIEWGLLPVDYIIAMCPNV